MRSLRTLYKTALLATAFFFLIVTSGCALPSYSLCDSGEPADALTDFMEAVNREDESKINDFLFNCTWTNHSDTPMENSDKELFEALQHSRSMKINNQSRNDSDKQKALVSISLTSLNMSLFEQALAENVEKDVQRKMFEGKKFTQPSDTADIIESNKQDLLKAPEQFYVTSELDVRMILSNGKWRVEMTDELYQSLLGLN